MAKHNRNTQLQDTLQNTDHAIAKDNCKTQLQSNSCKTTIAKQQSQNTNCKTTIAKHNCKTTISKHQLQNNNCKTTIAKQQVLKQNFETLRGTPPGSETKKHALLRLNLRFAEPSPPREPDGIVSKAIKNPYSLRLPLGKKRIKIRSNGNTR